MLFLIRSSPHPQAAAPRLQVRLPEVAIPLLFGYQGRISIRSPKLQPIIWVARTHFHTTTMSSSHPENTLGKLGDTVFSAHPPSRDIRPLNHIPCRQQRPNPPGNKTPNSRGQLPQRRHSRDTFRGWLWTHRGTAGGFTGNPSKAGSQRRDKAVCCGSVWEMGS